MQKISKAFREKARGRQKNFETFKETLLDSDKINYEDLLEELLDKQNSIHSSAGIN